MNHFKIFRIPLVICVLLSLLAFVPAVSAKSEAQHSSMEMSVYIVKLVDPPLALYDGSLNGLPATNPRLTGAKKVEVDHPDCVVYRSFLALIRAQILSDIQRELGRRVEVVYEYDIATNGFATVLTSSEAFQVAHLPGVLQVTVEKIRHLNKRVMRPFGTQRSRQHKYAVPGLTYLGSAGIFFSGFLFLFYIGCVLGNRGTSNKLLAMIVILTVLSLSLLYCCSDDDDDDGETADTPSLSAGWIGADSIWDGSATGNRPGTLGENIVIGIIDSGINPEHPSFAAIDDNDYVHTNPRDKYYGCCDPDEGVYDSTFPCNDKLIGAWGYAFNGDPRDRSGHGSHTASTAAGNILNATTITLFNGYTGTYYISGVAPHAHIISYSVCEEDGCPESHILAAVDQAIIDKVDVINFSIGGGPSDPWTDGDSTAFLAAMNAGIFVSASAGNAGPGEATIDSPSDSPWINSVGASTYNIIHRNSVINMSGGETSPPADMGGRGISTAYGPAPIIYAGDIGDPYCEGNFNTSLSGEIVVCELNLQIFPMMQAEYVRAAGGGGMVVAGSAQVDFLALLEFEYNIPATYIPYAEGVALKQWLSTGSGHQAAISGATPEADSDSADIMSFTSSRGPNYAVPSIIKPDLTGPGYNVIAAWSGGQMGDYALASGTSMSSPHASGAGILLKALNPGWTPVEIRSALMSTTITEGLIDFDEVTATDPFDYGAGRIELKNAGLAGLVFDETYSNFLKADPDLYFLTEIEGEGEPSQLNIASVATHACVETCQWKRIVKNGLNFDTSWSVSVTAPAGVSLTVTPVNFSLIPGGTQEILIDALVQNLAEGEWGFGQLIFTESNDQASPCHLPVAIRPMASFLPEKIEISTTSDSDSTTRYRFQARGISDLTVRITDLAPGDVTLQTLVSDPTNRDPFDGFDPETDGAFFITIDVPVNCKRLVAQIAASESNDIDLFVGYGDTPGYSTLISSSTSPGKFEYVNIDEPTAGTYWVVVQNWDPENGSSLPGQDVTLVTAIVPTTETGTMTVTPEFVSQTVFNVIVAWNIDHAEGLFWYGAFDLATDPNASSDNLGTVNVNLIREESGS
ncbi:S8 family serine peptidase [candidate division CSSED10-310 bacterium]|uniref:S8 family serine peptidase n=1 Tax=candidate division CSSED10-310 bacterium TaxID=2855610 RepID=A0ABV6YZV6_UNCC1